MANDVASIIHRVICLEQAAACLCDVAGFEPQSNGAGWALLGNGALQVRLETSGRDSLQGILNLEIVTGDLPAAVSGLLRNQGFAQIEKERSVSADRNEARVAAPNGFVFTVSRTFDEDELGFLPALPTTLDWPDEVQLQVQELLRAVPLTFRHLARVRVTEHVELLTIEHGEISVSLEFAIKGLVEMTPDFQLARLREEMIKFGIDYDHLLLEAEQS